MRHNAVTTHHKKRRSVVGWRTRRGQRFSPRHRTGPEIDGAGATLPSQPTSCRGDRTVCLADFEPLAKAKMPTMGWEYINAGAADEIDTAGNKEAYQRIRLKPHILVDVSKLDTP